VHEAVFGWVLERLTEHGLIKGDRIGVDASTMEANAALRAIVRRDSGEGYREMLKRLAVESGIATPTAEDLIRLDRKRKGKRLSNEDWTSPVDPEARIAKLKDGRTHLAYKPHMGDRASRCIQIWPMDSDGTRDGGPKTVRAALAMRSHEAGVRGRHEPLAPPRARPRRVEAEPFRCDRPVASPHIRSDCRSGP
jgi:transposase